MLTNLAAKVVLDSTMKKIQQSLQTWQQSCVNSSMINTFNNAYKLGSKVVLIPL